MGVYQSGFRSFKMTTFITLLVLSPTFSQVWNNLGSGECQNMRGKNETCTIGQFCSENSLSKGCRNCSEIYMYWLDKPEEFRLKYPTCEVYIIRELKDQEIKTLNETVSSLEKYKASRQTNLSDTETQLQLSDEENEKLRKDLHAKEDEVTFLTKMVIVAGIGSAFVSIIFVLSCLGCRRCYRRSLDMEARSTTARGPTRKSLWRKLLNFLCLTRTHNHRRPVPVAERDSLLLQPQETDNKTDIIIKENADNDQDNSNNHTTGNRNNIAQPSDSPILGGSNSHSSSNSTLSDVRVASGGTDHHLDDTTKDFVLDLSKNEATGS